MRPLSRALLLLAAALAGCGKDPFAGQKKNTDDGPTRIESPILPTDADKFDRGLVDAYEKLVAARGRRDVAAWKAAFAGAPGEDAGGLYDESTGPKVAKIHHQFRKADPDGDRAILTVMELIEERDPKAGVHNQEVMVTATLVKNGGAWKVEALKADWK